MKIKYLILTLLFVFSISQGKPLVVTTIKPLSDIAKEIGKNKVRAEYIIPPFASVHFYEYKISDIKKVVNADIFMFIGVGEPNINSIIKMVKKEKRVKVIDIPGLNLIYEFEFEDNHHHHEDGEEGKLPHPAVWLDPENAKTIGNYIYKKLSKIDPQNRDFYLKNYKEFENKINKLIKDGNNKFSSLKNKNFVSYHYAYPYFVKRFKLNYLAVIELGHGREPTPKHLLEVIKKIKKHRVKSLFASKQFYNPKYAKLILNATKIKLVMLDPFGINKNYVEMMEEIINKVYNGMK
jgi:zinc transport system substrate-binding protein